MPNTIKSRAAKYKEQRSPKKKIYAWFAALALVVAVGTLWALVQPASTMSGQIICGMEEHTHTEDCYERQLICDQEEGEAHTHTDACWEDVLVCSKPEHAHIAECYDVTEPVKEQAPQPEQAEASVSSEEQSGSDAGTDPEQPVAEQTAEETESAAELVPEVVPQVPAKQEELLEEMRKTVPADYTDLRTAQLPEGGTVYLFAQPGVIPEQVELKAQLVDASSEVFAQAEQRVKDSGVTYDYMKALDIALVDETGAEVEPTAPVYVSMDAGALLPKEADSGTIRIQHHKEILPQDQDDRMQNEAVPTADGPEVVVESVLDDTKGTLTQIENTTACVATFPVDSFSVYTVTSAGWPNLKIRIECVDEYGNELRADHKPADVVLNSAHRPGAAFDVVFMSGEHPKIENYQYAGNAYFMRNGAYESRIYGLRRENGKWYYRPNDNDKSRKTEFTVQPNFEVGEDGSDPPDFIRLIYRKVTDIPVQYMDDAGSVKHQEISLSSADAPNGKNPDVITYTGTVLDISDIAAMPRCSNYFYVGRAYVGAPKRENEVVKVIREDGQPYGVTEEGKKLLVSKETPLKVMYHRIQTDITNLETMPTVSTADKGLIINLFDYNSGNSAMADELINAGKNFHFGPYDIKNYPPEQNAAYNRWTGKDGGVYTGIVEDTLVNGYPVLTDGKQSLDYLFNPDLCKQELEQEKDPAKRKVKHVHTNLDHLFWQDQDGYYRFDAMTNFATIMDKNASGGGHDPQHNDGGNFIVYRQPALPGQEGAKFMPFNTYAEANKPGDKNGQNGKNYHFGMTMEADFVMPPGGRIPDASGAHTGLRDMIFEFNGDDDVWVFIDDELVLDLGGIHGRYGGTINFRTGEVTTNAPPAPHSGWSQDNLYNIEGDPNALSEDALKQAREAAGFGKYSQHHFKFFYLERGQHASNCEIRFNLVPVEHGLVIGKRIPEHMDGAATEHMWYQFQVEAEHNGERHPLANATYRRIEWKPDVHPVTGGHTIDVGQTDENGRFWLRAGERADFVGAVDLKHAGVGEHDNIKIYVSEIFPDGTVVPQVTAWSGKEEAPGTHMVISEPNGTTRKLIPPLYDSTGWPDYPKVLFHTDTTETPTELKVEPETRESMSQAVVTTGRHNEFNWIDFENNIGALSGLNITKHARHTESGAPIPDVPFAIKVELWDTKDNQWIPLPVGAEYWILDRVPNPGEKLPEDTKLQLTESDHGLISIVDGQTIHLHILPGTRYRVSEALSLEEAAVYTATYEGQTGVAGEELEVYQEAGKQSGIGNKIGIAAGNQHHITITNTGDPILMPDGSLVLAKQAMGVVPPNAKFQFNLRIQDYFTDATTGGYQPELQCAATYYGSPEGAHQGNPQHGCQETLVFKPTTTDGSTRGENYEADLFLYPGEIVVIEGLPQGKAVYVQEVFGEDQTGFYEVSFHEEGKEPVIGKATETAPIGPNHVVKVTCMNQSNLQENSAFKLSKKVKRTDQPNGNPLPEDMTKPFAFRLSLQKPAMFSPDQISAKVMSADGLITYFTLKFEPSGENYVAEVRLLHGDTMTIEGLPTDAQLVVQELGHDGYVASMNDAPGDRITVDLRHNTGAAYQVRCVNMTGVELPETGGHGVALCALVGAAMMLSAAGLLWLRHRHGKSGNA